MPTTVICWTLMIPLTGLLSIISLFARDVQIMRSKKYMHMVWVFSQSCRSQDSQSSSTLNPWVYMATKLSGYRGSKCCRHSKHLICHPTISHRWKDCLIYKIFMFSILHQISFEKYQVYMDWWHFEFLSCLITESPYWVACQHSMDQSESTHHNLTYFFHTLFSLEGSAAMSW